MSSSLQETATRGSLVAVKRLLAANAPIDQQDDCGNTALIISAIEGHYNIAEYLFNNGADASIQGSQGRTALHQAIYRGKQTIVSCLLPNIERAKPFINLTDDSGDTPLHTAVRTKQNVFIEQLLRCGAEVSCPNLRNKTAFTLADRNQQNFITKICKQENNKIISSLPGYKPLDKSNKQSIFEVIEEGNKELVNVMLDVTDINTLNNAGQSLLYIAVQSCHEDIISLLLSKQANPNILCGDDNSSKLSSLHCAAMTCPPNILNILINSRANINIQDSNKRTPLHFAAEWKKTENVNTLLKANANPTITDKNNRTPLHQAAVFGRYTIIKLLLSDSRIQINQKDNLGRTPLHLSTLWNWNKCISCLINDGNANIEEADNEGLHPLHYAVKWNKLRSLKILLELKADPTVMDQNGLTPIHYARKSNNIDIENQLMANVPRKAPKPPPKDRHKKRQANIQKLKKKIIAAANKGDTTVLSSCLTNPLLNLKIIQSAIFAAARSGKAEIIEEIVENIDDVDFTVCFDDKNQSLLHASILGGNEDIVNEFISEDIPVNHQDNKGNTALHLAVIKKVIPLGIIRMLCSCNDINLGIQNKNGNTPLHLLFLKPPSEKQVLKRLEVLLSYYSIEQLNITNSIGSNALLSAVSQLEINIPAVSLLIESGIDLNAFNNEKRNALSYIIKRNNVALAKKLVLCGAIIHDEEALLGNAEKRIKDEILDAIEELNQSKTNNNTENIEELFHELFENGDINKVNEWINNGGNVHITDEYSSIPLHIACMNGHLDIVKILLEAKSDPNITDDNLQTPLHLAAMKGHSDVVTILLEFNADPNVYDSEDQAPLDWASMLNHDTVIDILTPITS